MSVAKVGFSLVQSGAIGFEVLSDLYFIKLAESEKLNLPSLSVLYSSDIIEIHQSKMKCTGVMVEGVTIVINCKASLYMF